MAGLIVFALGFVVGAQEKPLSPAEQFQALLKEYDRVPGAGTITTDEERLKHIGKVYRHHNEVGEKFLALAAKYPDDPVAVDALMRAVWQVNTTPWPAELVGDDAARRK